MKLQFGRRLLAPEVLQPSDIDCGPAALQSACEGFGVVTHWTSLREACRTSIDGTSIDVVEELALELGLEAEQILVPPEMLRSDSPELLPAIAVMRAPNGAPHFVLLWRRWGRWIEIMDPAIGRRFVLSTRLTAELLSHRQAVPAATWHEWAGSSEARGSFATRLRAAGASRSQAEAWVEEALNAPDWRSIAHLGAILRFVERLKETGLAASHCRESLQALATPGTDRERLAIELTAFADARPAAEETSVEVSGAILVRLRGRRSGPSEPRLLSDHELARVRQRSTSPRAALGALLPRGGAAWGTLLAAGFGSGATVAIQALLFQALLGSAAVPLAAVDRWTLVVGVVALLALGTTWTWLRADLARRLGRRAEIRARGRLLERLRTLPDSFLARRLPADLVERLNSTTLLRDAPALLATLAGAFGQLAATVIGVAALFPVATLPIALAAFLSIFLPAVSRGLQRTAGLRSRTLRAFSGQLFLDALQGLLPVRAAAAEERFAGEHGRQVAAWKRAAGAELQMTLLAELALALSTYAAVASALVSAAREGATPGLLLLLYWAIQIPSLGDAIAASGHSLARLEGVARRLDEMLASGEEVGLVAARQPPPALDKASPGARIEFSEVALDLGGRPVLREISITIGGGERLAIVGESGAGKSTLLSLLLGWQQPTAGSIRVDGRLHDPASAALLRSETVWLDPQVTLWDRSLAANIAYGNRPGLESLRERLDLSGLDDLTFEREEGLGLRLGEGGRAISGGEAQRVRWARAAGRSGPRLVVFDEPFRGLERAERERQLEGAFDRYPGATFLCVLHDADSLAGFDRILRLNRGAIAGFDSGTAEATSAAAAGLASGPTWEGYLRWRLADGIVGPEPEGDT